MALRLTPSMVCGLNVHSPIRRTSSSSAAELRLPLLDARASVCSLNGCARVWPRTSRWDEEPRTRNAFFARVLHTAQAK